MLLKPKDVRKLVAGLPEEDREEAMALAMWLEKYISNPRPLVRCVGEHPLDAVVVLSGPGTDELHHEDDVRIKKGVEISKDAGCMLVLNGGTHQEGFMRRVALELGSDEGSIVFVDAGPDGVANTATQMDVMSSWFEEGIILITSEYHAARVFLTALRRLEGVHFQVVPTSSHGVVEDLAELVLGEIRRIVQYSRKGDIAKAVNLP